MSDLPINSPTKASNCSLGEAHFQSIAEKVSQIITLVDPDHHRIKYVNRLTAPTTFEQVLGKSIYDFISSEEASKIKLKIEEVKRTRLPLTYDIEAKSRTKPGGRVWYKAQISVILGPTDSIESLMFLLEDVTDSKLQEIENINTDERIKAIINNTRDVICSIDNNFNLLEFNSTFKEMVKRGYGKELQPGMPVLDFVDPARHETLKLIYKKVQGGETCMDIASFNTITGVVVYNETSYNPIYNSEKQISGISIFSKDISERVRSEQKIINALKEKEVLLAEIHHRIKNNLAMVSSLLQLQEMNIVHPEAKAALAISRKRIKSTALIHELLYRNESFQNINLHDYLKELFEHLKIDDSIKLNLLGDEVILNLTTAMPLGLLLNEIMLNSFKHSHKDKLNGKTEIETRITDNLLVINYCDCSGTFPDHVDFYNSQTTGLTLIHTFIEQLNGKIELVTRTPPKYKIQIPLDENH